MIIIISLEALTWLVFAVLGGVVIFANATRLLALLFAVLGAGIWMTYVLIAFANRNRKGRAADVAVPILGFAAVLASVRFFSGSQGVHPAAFLWMGAFLLLAAVAFSVGMGQRPVLRTLGACACIALALMWSIGLDYSYGAKVDEHNIAWYEMLADGRVMDTDAPGIWGATSYYNPQTGEVYSEADGHWLADYEKGQVFYPAADEAEPEAACRNEGDSFIDRAYYPVRLGDGKTGYVFSGRKNGCNVAVYYFDDSALVQQTQARLRRLRWYGALPEPVLQGCAGLFERLHPSLRMQLTRQAD